MITQDLYVLEGGIGKNICFTNCLNKLGKVNLMSTWPKVFLHHPNVNYCYNYMINPIRDDVEFFNKFKNIHFVEGYDSYFLKNKIHLVNNFRKILNQDVDEAIYNEIYFSEEEEENIKPLLEQLNNFVLVQFVGTDEGHQDTDFITSRSLLKQEAQKIILIT